MFKKWARIFQHIESFIQNSLCLKKWTTHYGPGAEVIDYQNKAQHQ